MPSGLFCLNSVDRSISNRRGVWLHFIITMFYEFHVLNAKSEDPDPTPLSAASDLGLHALPVFYLWDARIKLVNSHQPGKLTILRAAGCGLQVAGCGLRAAGHI